MDKLLSDPAIIAAIGVLVTAIAALVQAKVAENKADLAEKHASKAEDKADIVQGQTNDLHVKLASTTEQVTALKDAKDTKDVQQS